MQSKRKNMAKYIKQEMPDLNKVGENKAYYRMETSRRVSMEEFVETIAMPGHGITAGEAKQVLGQAAHALARLLSEGCVVTIDGIGTFKATVGVRDDKEQDAFAADEPQRNAQSIEVNGVHYKVDKRLVRDINVQCHARTWQAGAHQALALHIRRACQPRHSLHRGARLPHRKGLCRT